MTIKNFVTDGVFNTFLSGALTQSNAFSGAVQVSLQNLSGIAVSVKALNPPRQANGLPISARCHVSIPTVGDADQDRMRGALVGLSTTTPSFKAAVDTILASGSGFPSTLVDVDTTLDRAIENQPPGLVPFLPADLDFVPVGAPSPTSLLFHVKVITGPLAPAASLVQNYTLTTTGISFVTVLSPPNQALVTPTVQWPGEFKHELAYSVGADALLTIADSEIPLADVKQNAVSVGNLFSSGSFVNGPNRLSNLSIFISFLSLPLLNSAIISEFNSLGGFIANLQKQYGRAATAIPASSAGTLTFKHTTAAPIPAGTPV